MRTTGRADALGSSCCSPALDDEALRFSIAVHGLVQGVGFRPFVHSVARGLDLAGFVRNHVDGVDIEVEGPAARVASFFEALESRPPILARIDGVRRKRLPPTGERKFRIHPSEAADGHHERERTSLPPDLATCDECLSELFDRANRRFLYPFITCTSCGPRLSIATAAPFDRERTTMAAFVMCDRCRAEYEDPEDRRFHAQTIACPSCGPALALVDGEGRGLPGEALSSAVALLESGAIVAIKGLGGFHLACDAADARAVRELRRRKHRDDKPFAVMAADVARCDALSELSNEERALLTSVQRPIVLLQKREPAPLADEVTRGSSKVGVLLPYTPLHHLLLRELSLRFLVMTSGNRGGEPIAFDDGEARERLGGLADAFLTHDRPIHLRADDSVVKLAGETRVLVRRSRGHAPEPLPLPFRTPPILAVGGHSKCTFALGRGERAVLSQHVGDLDDDLAARAFEGAVADFEALFGIHPELIAHDLHPTYATTAYARERAKHGIPLVGVQHHHAHMASCMADNGLSEPVIGVTFDGNGLGTDGTLWGGEFLIGDYREVRRAAHLRAVALPGSEQATREPWRMALAHLLDAGHAPSLYLSPRIADVQQRIAAQMIARRLNSPLTSSAGRLFDAIASLLGVRDRVTFEGQAANDLEALAEAAPTPGRRPYAFAFDVRDDGIVIDTRPLVDGVARDIARKESIPDIALRFHATVAAMVASTCRRLREAYGIDAVVLTGGVFLNALLLRRTKALLTDAAFRVYQHARVPPNDGGLCLGQLAVAAHRTAAERREESEET